MKPKEDKRPILEESLYVREVELLEVPVGKRSVYFLAILFSVLFAILFFRLFYLGFVKHNFYANKAEANLNIVSEKEAPRGLIFDRNGNVLADNEPSFSVFLDIKKFLSDERSREKTLAAVYEIFGTSESELARILEINLKSSRNEAILQTGVTPSDIIKLKDKKLETLIIKDSVKRFYPYGESASAILGYVGLPGPYEIDKKPNLSISQLVGKDGVEAFYDDTLRGKNGITVKIRDAKGKILGEEMKSIPEIGRPLTLTIDADFQAYFYKRMKEGLASLGRSKGAGLAMDPRSGEILALLSFPTFDNNVFVSRNKNSESIAKILNDPSQPLFNRVISGVYAPGSTIKPLVGAASLYEGVITPRTIVFSPGYLDIPNPYNPENPTRYLDWRYQGEVNLAAAIAQSSNVYFYTVGGGTNNFNGLGIQKLYEWWKKFGLGSLTGVDLPGEKSGFLPTPRWKEETKKKPWLLGDTYNVSIGQGDLLVTPIQLLSYINSIANKGISYEPHLRKDKPQKIFFDLSYLEEEIKEVEKGMLLAVDSSLGTAHLLNDLPFKVAAKTGSAQVQNNKQENAFFVGYAPVPDPKISVLVLVENSLGGSFNAIPIAKDVLRWYYENRLK